MGDPVKPIADLGRHWLAFLEGMKTWLGPLNIMVIGGGAGGVELALAIDHRLRVLAKGAQLQVTLATKDEILAGMAVAAQRKMRTVFQRRGLRLLEKAATVRIERGAVQLENGKWLQADAVFVVTEASAAKWFATTGLPLDESGFIAVDDTLRSTGDERVFAVGDCATMLKHRRPKAGVFAVRQGPPLTRNLRRVVLGEAPRTLLAAKPLSLDHRHRRRSRRRRAAAVGRSKGAWVWRWKDHIDREWMRQFASSVRPRERDFSASRCVSKKLDNRQNGARDRPQTRWSRHGGRTPLSAPGSRSFGPRRPRGQGRPAPTALMPARARWSAGRRRTRKAAERATGESQEVSSCRVKSKAEKRPSPRPSAPCARSPGKRRERQALLGRRR